MAVACTPSSLVRPTQSVRNSLLRLCIHRQMFIIAPNYLGNPRSNIHYNTCRSLPMCQLKRGQSLNHKTMTWMSMAESFLRKASKPHHKHLVQVASISIGTSHDGDGNGNGNGGGVHGDGDGGDGGFEAQGGEPVQEGASSTTTDVILLDVGGMSCGGCAASVKRILESQPQVASASVNFATETAVVWTVPEARAIDDWQKVLGENLAKHLTNCGFTSGVRDTWNS